jgi:hypothetical protein
VGDKQLYDETLRARRDANDQEKIRNDSYESKLVAKTSA